VQGIQIVEVALIVSTVAYAMLFVATLLYRDGRIWTVFRLNVFFGLLASLGGYVAIREAVFTSTTSNFTLTWVVVGLVGLSRLAGAITNLLLAFHLRELIRRGTRPRESAPDYTPDLHRRESGDGGSS
jgi:hypothetical protein